jgi:hypothetical protein
MLAEQSEVTSLPADLVYTKTEKGRAEVARRSAGLSARQRSILIMLDGQKGVEALTALVPPAHLNAVLAELSALDLIAPMHGQAVAPARNMADLAPVRALMIRSAQTYLGSMASELIRQIDNAADAGQLQRTILGSMASELIRQIDNAADAGQLQRTIGHWHMAMQASKYGREVAAAHLALVKASLQAAASTPA